MDVVGFMGGKFGYETFLSPFTWRYGSEEMRRIFSEVEYRATWRRIWAALAEAQAECGLISRKELAEIKSKADREHVDIELAHRLEREIKHDLMAELKVFARQCPKGGGKLHLGATSADIEDNADVLRMREALDLVLTRLVNCLHSLSKRIEEYKSFPCMGWTHLQPAEPTTLGYRFAFYAQDLLMDIKNVEDLATAFLRGKGIKGVVGVSAGFKELLKGKRMKPKDLESRVMSKLGLRAFTISTQTYPRKLDFLVLSVLAGIGQSVHKFGVDVRHLQSPVWGEFSEPIGKAQVGSSAMPFKRNPVLAERMCSLARYVASLPRIAWENAAHTVFERTLDDSANRRIAIAEAFLTIDECLIIYDQIIRGMTVNREMVKRNLDRFSPFAANEPILMRLTEKGYNRQEIHERLRKLSFEAWREVMRGKENPLPSLLRKDELISSVLKESELERILDVRGYVGDAVERCKKFLRSEIKPVLSRYAERVGKRRKTSF